MGEIVPDAIGRTTKRANARTTVRLLMVPIAMGSALTLTACAASSDAEPVGPDTYSLSAAASVLRGGTFAARTMALKDAGAFCARNGKQILVRNISTRDMGGPGESTVIFRCLSPGDRELARPNFKSAPNMVIENRIE